MDKFMTKSYVLSIAELTYWMLSVQLKTLCPENNRNTGIRNMALFFVEKLKLHNMWTHSIDSIFGMQAGKNTLSRRNHLRQ